MFAAETGRGEYSRPKQEIFAAETGQNKLFASEMASTRLNKLRSACF